MDDLIVLINEIEKILPAELLPGTEEAAAKVDVVIEVPDEVNPKKLQLTMTQRDMLHLHVVAKYMHINKYTKLPDGFIEVIEDLIKQQAKPRSRSNSLTSNNLSRLPLADSIMPPTPKRRPSLPTLKPPIPHF